MGNDEEARKEGKVVAIALNCAVQQVSTATPFLFAGIASQVSDFVGPVVGQQVLGDK